MIQQCLCQRILGLRFIVSGRRIESDHFEQVLDGLVLAFLLHRVNRLLHHRNRVSCNKVSDPSAQGREIRGAIDWISRHRGPLGGASKKKERTLRRALISHS